MALTVKGHRKLHRCRAPKSVPLGSRFGRSGSDAPLLHLSGGSVPKRSFFPQIGPFSSVDVKFEATGAALTASDLVAGLSTRRQMVHFSTAESGALFGRP